MKKLLKHIYQTNGASRDPCCAKCGEEDWHPIHKKVAGVPLEGAKK